MNTKLQKIIKRYTDDFNANKFENIVREAIKDDVLDELLDICYGLDIPISPEIVTEQLYDFYITRVVKTEDERARYRKKMNYLINKHQVVVVKTMDIPQNN